jgi:serine phosphatase RsbU (regulator of sigma subunit)
MAPGDYLVLCSDGLLEAEDPSGQIIGYEQTAQLISSACDKQLSPQETLDTIIEVLDNHRNGAAQTDDITCVVLRREYGDAVPAS